MFLASNYRLHSGVSQEFTLLNIFISLCEHIDRKRRTQSPIGATKNASTHTRNLQSPILMNTIGQSDLLNYIFCIWSHLIIYFIFSVVVLTGSFEKICKIHLNE